MTTGPGSYRTASGRQGSFAALLTSQAHRAARWLPFRHGPQSVLVVATFINTTGSGLFIAGSALYFTRVVGLTGTMVGLGLGTGALVGVFAGVPAGHLADRAGPREACITTSLCSAAAMAAFCLARSFWVFVAAASLMSAAASASLACRAPLIRRLGGTEGRRFRAYLRSVTNLGVAVGVLAAGVAIEINTKTAYLSLVAGNCVSSVLCAAALTRLPHLRPVPAPAGGSRLHALRDRPFLAVTLLNGVLCLHYDILTFALPLWVENHTRAPRWMITIALLLNTCFVVALQVPTSRRVTDSRTAAARMRWAGAALSGGLALMALAAGPSPVLAAAALALGTAAYSVGELWHTAAAFELSFGLAPAHAQGQYAGTFGFGQGLANAAGPAVLAVMCLTWGRTGWMVLGGLMLTVGTITPGVVAWARRSRPWMTD